MTEATPTSASEEAEVEITSPPAKTANEEDHSDPDVFRGEDAGPPENPSPAGGTA